jgi:signal transduction histidine kinase/phage shock protein PspC (stress-responsive transcriptional regulator)
MSTAVAPPRAVRPLSGRVVAGVARGLAQHLRVPVWLVRVGFVVLAFAGGIGIVLYAALWAVLPLDVHGTDVDPESARSSDTARLLALAAIVVGVGLLLAALGVDVASGAVLPIIVAVFGAALVWRQTDDEQRDAWSQAAGRAAERTAGTAAQAGRWRIGIGVALVMLAVVALVATRTTPAQAAQGLAVALLIVGGIALVVFPWLYRTWRDQATQRRALIRSEERAEIAAHVHDSVLQTLTLIQRFSDDPAEVTRLARTEERNLRAWLYAPAGDPDRTVAAAIARDAAAVESDYAATVEVVSVGDAPLDPSLGALVAAAREAMVNAARHGGGQVSVYVECRDDVIEAYVRDRGAGFDVAAVPDDRHGVRESIMGRMERNGGSAQIRVSQGTEVHLSMPRVTEAAR